MAYQIKITTPAEDDIYSAFDRIKKLAPLVSEKWLRGIFKSIFTLSEMPDRCPIAPESEALGLPIRHLFYGKRTAIHRIIFDIQNEAKADPLVRILRVWHSKKDQIQVEDLDLE